MSQLLESLCALFDEELERQEALLALTRAQGEAAMARDAQVLEARTEAIRLLVSESLRSEQARLALVAEIVEAFALAAPEQTLSGLIAVAEEPWKSRLAWHQERLRTVVTETQGVVRSNHRTISRLARSTASLLRRFHGESESPVYGASGAAAGTRYASPRLVNQAG
ncbi:MAG: hypothetical protein GC168_11475 [Candidatus Hydrogenedens sp.]|nr:hypothetical protein [Candidatus Hydrogenedens sp.]